MKKLLSLVLLTAFFVGNAQETANRFFYELTFKPKKEAETTEKVMTVLDITKDKSIYRDYTILAQDSILKVQVEAMQKSGVFKDLSKSITQPKFAFKVRKAYPSMKYTYSETISSGFTPIEIAYSDDAKIAWKIDPSAKQTIGAYKAQKATADFGGRQWTAWFTNDIPFQDGPYKFSGLPGLIVKIEDSGKNYSWELKGNKKIENYNEVPYIETISFGGAPKLTEVSKEKFEKTYNDYKKDPFATARPMLKPEMLSQKMPGSDVTIGEMVKQQEKMLKEFYESNNNPIEIETAPAKSGK